MNQLPEKNRQFDKEMTLTTKGIFICLLLFIHTYGVQTWIPLDLQKANIYDFISHIGKVCVVGFIFLSGYGCVKSYQKSNKSIGKFALTNIIRLYRNFWFIYCFCAIEYYLFHGSLKNAYGEGLPGFICFIKDIFGFADFITYSPSIGGVWWFMSAIVCCYVLFPVTYLLVKRGRAFALSLAIITYIPWIIWMFSQQTIILGRTTDSFVYYFNGYVVGVIFAEFNVLDRIVSISNNRKIVCMFSASIGLFLCMLIRSQVCMPLDILLCIAIVVFVICVICHFSNLMKMLVFLGINSSAMYMFHARIKEDIMCNFGFSKWSYNILFFIFINLSIATLLNDIEKGLLKTDKNSLFRIRL